jgi:hypothetical protein
MKIRPKLYFLLIIFISFCDVTAAAISGGEYDARDLKRLDTDDAYARCFLRTLLSKGDVAKSLPLIDSAFKFRKEFQINGRSGLLNVREGTLGY